MSDSPSSEVSNSLDALIRNARLEQSPPGLESRVLKSVNRASFERRSRRRFAISLGAGAAAAGLSLFFWVSGESTTPSVTPEAVAPQPIPPRKSSPVCEKRTVAGGGDPLIDDFEYQGSKPEVREGRQGSWEFITDKNTDQQGPFYSLTSLLPLDEQTATNQRAMHLEIAPLRDWGASLEYAFQPERCYDASVYQGIRFRAKGGVRLQVAARQPEVIPTKYGGSCENGCYISHLKTIDLNDTWTLYEVSFKDLHKRGYDSKPLDASRIHSLQFSVQSEDTPADIWIDDISWMK